MTQTKVLHLLGYASGLAGAVSGCSDGPIIMQRSPFLAELNKIGIDLQWQDMISPIPLQQSKLSLIAEQCHRLAIQTNQLTTQKKLFAVLGGDHSSAIGTWSGVSHALKNQGSLGLIWVDAHLDSHTPHTSLTGNIHGMPVACLLGYGTSSLVNILNSTAKIKPEHLCLIGVRSFERGEAALLKKLNVRVFFMDEVKQRGLDAVMNDALKIATNGTAGFGISIDIDSIDPDDAPGTGTPEPNGISAKELCQSLKKVAQTPHLLGFEIVEFDPHRDKYQQTEKLIPQMIATMLRSDI